MSCIGGITSDPVGLEIRESSAGDWLCLSLLGELDICSGPDLVARLTELQSVDRPVLIDLSRLAFMDSSGVAVLVRAIGSSRARGWSFKIGSDLAPQVEKLFNLAGLTQLAGIDAMDSSPA